MNRQLSKVEVSDENYFEGRGAGREASAGIERILGITKQAQSDVVGPEGSSSVPLGRHVICFELGWQQWNFNEPGFLLSFHLCDSSILSNTLLPFSMPSPRSRMLLLTLGKAAVY